MAVEVIEAKLVSVLDNILSPVSIFRMFDDQVVRLAGEPEEIRAEREQLNKQLEVLRNGLKTCKRFVGFRISGGMHDSNALPNGEYILMMLCRLGLCSHKGNSGSRRC